MSQQQQQQQVWLGLAGDLVGPSDAPDYYSTKVGGCAVLPGVEPPAELLSGCTCSVCGRPLSLLMQAHAPHSAAQERVLLVLGCTKLGCGKEAGCYQALRFQLPPQQQQQQQPEDPAAAAAAAAAAPQESAAAPAAAAAVGFDALSAADDDWGDAGDWGTPGSTVTGTSCGAFDFSDLVESLEAAGQQAAAAAKANAKAKQQPAAEASAAAAAGAEAVEAVVCCSVAAGPQLPGFYVYSEAEPDEAAAKAISSKELQHVQQLLAAYEAAEAAAGASSSSTIASSSRHQQQQQVAAAAAASTSDAAAAAADEGGSWAGEGYEEDQLRGVERGYLKFSKRLARQPQQCARYSLGGLLLWPKPQLPRPPPCPACGSARQFELQLMPSLMQLSIEAAQMALEQQLPVDTAVVDAVANWDWATVAVFTCQASCSSSSSTTQPQAAVAAAATVDKQQQQQQQQQCEVFSEAVFLINEQDCHVALPPPVPGIGAGTETGAAPSAAAAAPNAAAAGAAAVAAVGEEGDGGEAEEADSFDDDDAEGDDA